MERQDKTDVILALRPRLLRRARRYTKDWAAAEDLVQETLLRVWARLERDPPVDDLERYLFRALRNLAIRSPRREDPLEPEDMPQEDPAAERRIATSEVLVALSHLPPAQATLILGHAVDGESYAELARRHRLPLGTVMSRVARGRAQLRAAMEMDANSSVLEMLSG